MGLGEGTPVWARIRGCPLTSPHAWRPDDPVEWEGASQSQPEGMPFDRHLAGDRTDAEEVMSYGFVLCP